MELQCHEYLQHYKLNLPLDLVLQLSNSILGKRILIIERQAGPGART